MKAIITTVIFVFALVGCTEVNSVSNSWEGWTSQASHLARHYDEQLGVACYLSTRDSHRTYKSSSLSCVKVK